MPTARNEAELNKMLSDGIQLAVHYVVEKILQENVSIIDEIVYNAYAPKDYVRTHQFRNAWSTTLPSTNPTSYAGYGKIYYNPTKVKASYFGQHMAIADGKKVKKGDSSAEYLADIIYHGQGGTAWGGDENPTRKRRNAYKELVLRIGKRKISNWMYEGLKAQGFKVQRHKIEIEKTKTWGY